ncbi:hypothetical protein MLD38_014539 [Melastoma candidum]|uniref:Uncharacterized protein n=1 Tax=Melastoma candidum TaxID=119954 RepID=A0ACB9RD73_9MYRT|nr:hypothetical protein MLD38_014539 [Melastoma candidum]
MAGHGQTDAGCELIASLVLKNRSTKLARSKHRNNFLNRIKLRISKLSTKLRQNSKRVSLRNGSNDERLINFRRRSPGKVSSGVSEKQSFGCYKENSKKVLGDKTTKGGDDAGSKKMRKKKRNKRKRHVEPDEASRLQRRTRYLVIKMKLEQNLIDAYSNEGWKGQSQEKIKPLMELQRSKRQIWNCKLGIRDAIRQLDTLGSVGSIGDSVMAPNGVVHHEHIFCARCQTNEVFPDNDIILCDGTCNCAFHQKCLDPLLETESIPPGDQGWFCKYCDCKMDIIDAMNAHLGTQFPLDSSWQDIFKEEAALTNGKVYTIDFEEKWPSDDSEDDDYNPVQKTVEPSIISGPRLRATVDYKKLYTEMFGKDAPACETISDDEDWGPARKRRQKETDAVGILLTLHESSGNFLNHEISQGDEEIPRQSSKRPVFRLPPSSVEKLRQVFSQNELPSRSVREDLSKDLGIQFEKVNKWFKNARYTALKSRKIHNEPEELAASKTVPGKPSAEALSLQPKDLEGVINMGFEEHCETEARKSPQRRFFDAQSSPKTKVSIDLDDNICLKERLTLLRGRKTEKGAKRVGFVTDEGRQREREWEMEWLCRIKGRIDGLKQRMVECRGWDGSTSCKPSVVYVPVAVVREKGG